MRGDFVGREEIVGIEELNEVAAGEAEGVVAGGAGAGIGLGDDADAAGFERAGEGEAVVGRAVVDENDFGARMGLREGGFERGGEPRSSVVAGDEDRNERNHRAGGAKRRLRATTT